MTDRFHRIANLRLAVPGGPDSRFLTAVCFGRTAEVCAEFLRSGRRVEVTGRERQRSWVGQDGAEPQTDEVVASRVQFLPGGVASEPQAESERAVA
ncbi:MAG TPA: single-stranded DNA-binding protein [Solirubrobacteraceae bacterium]|nr:single-stranded DNA-binding protein [Solirubrobacteraceae bacterium]